LQAAAKPAAEPYRSVALACPLLAVELVDLIRPLGVNTCVNASSVLATTRAGPCQLPSKAISKGSGRGAPPEMSREVREPSVRSQAWIWPVSWKL
jgi:hypothetical protein